MYSASLLSLEVKVKVWKVSGDTQLTSGIWCLIKLGAPEVRSEGCGGCGGAVGCGKNICTIKYCWIIYS